MAMPTWEEFIDTVVHVLGADSPLTLQEIYVRAAEARGLTETEREETLASGQLRHWNRIGWAVTDTMKAGLLSRPARATYAITDEGRRRLVAGQKITVQLLKEYPEYVEYRFGKREASDTEAQVEVASELSGLTPAEALDTAASDLDLELQDQVFRALHAIEDPYHFELLVTKFIALLGYGDGSPDSWTRTSQSNDKGIDGVVWRDKLGLERVYIQAKKYGVDNVVTPDMVRSFSGSLDVHRAVNGVFITTSSFTKNAKEEVEQTRNKNIRLIDGRDLAKLMVRNKIGVTVERTIEVKRIDTDFFTLDA